MTDAEARKQIPELIEKLNNVQNDLHATRESLEGYDKAWAEETRALEHCEMDRVKGDEEIARLDEELKKVRAASDGFELELHALRVTKRTDADVSREERDEARRDLMECRRALDHFIADCAALLELPKLDEHSEYGGGAIRKGIERLKKRLGEAELTAAGVIEGSAEWEDDCKTAQKQVKELDHTLGISVDHAQKAEREILRLREKLKEHEIVWEEDRAKLVRSLRDRTEVRKQLEIFRSALDKINTLRNDIIARQHMGWSAHIYPLVAALDTAGLEGAHYEDARKALEATIAEARGLAATAWCKKATEKKVMDAELAEEFAEILFPFLEALEFYGRLGNWQGDKDGQVFSVCDRDLGARARVVMGRPDLASVEDAESDD